MKPPKLKICGMMHRDNILQVASANPDYMGFIFYKGSPRYVGEKFTVPDIGPSIKRIGVFVNEATKAIRDVAEKVKLDGVQLHGEETPLQCRELRGDGVCVIKAFLVDDEFDFTLTKPYEDAVDYFLFDAKGRLRGGNGLPFDWELLDRYHGRIPFFLSGGVGVDNASLIKGITHKQFYAIDVNSGIEDKPGLKSSSKLYDLLKHLK